MILFHRAVVNLHAITQHIPCIDQRMPKDFLLLLGARSFHWFYLYINVASGTAVQFLVQFVQTGAKIWHVCPKGGCVNTPKAYPPDFLESE